MSEIKNVEYTPYGETWIDKSDDLFDMLPYKFTAKELDDETGLYYYGARYLNPRTSRWISSDPEGFELINPMKEPGKPKENYSLIEATNWYSYTSNNPVRYTDPTGKESADAAYARQQALLDARPLEPLPPVNPQKPIPRASSLLGVPYGASMDGSEKGFDRMPFDPKSVDCTELLAYGNDSGIYRSWEIGDNPDYQKVDSPKPGDMKIWRATSPKTGKEEGHAAFITGESGSRALLHSDPRGVRYSSDYLEGYYKKHGYTNIQIDYYRRREE